MLSRARPSARAPCFLPCCVQSRLINRPNIVEGGKPSPKAVRQRNVSLPLSSRQWRSQDRSAKLQRARNFGFLRHLFTGTPINRPMSRNAASSLPFLCKRNERGFGAARGSLPVRYGNASMCWPYFHFYFQERGRP